MRCYFLVSFEDSAATDDNTVTLDLPDIDKRCSWPASELRDARAAFPTAAVDEPAAAALPSPPSTLPPDIVEAVAAVLARDPKTAGMDAVQFSAAQTFLTLFLFLGLGVFPTPCTFTVRSTLPVGAGLGSSASFNVCLSAAMLHQRVRRDTRAAHLGDVSVASESLLQAIIEWSLLGEMCVHGTPSGVDNAVATLGNAVVFRKQMEQRTPTRPTITALPNLPNTELLLIDTGVSRSTTNEVSKVRNMRDEQPGIVEGVFESIHQVTLAAVDVFDALAEEHDSEMVSQLNGRLGRMFDINHNLLTALGVSHPKIEQVRDAVCESGAGWAKLTGAGGGGCVIALLRDSASAETIGKLQKRLTSMGTEAYKLNLGAPGVCIDADVGAGGRESFATIATERLEGVFGLDREDQPMREGSFKATDGPGRPSIARV